MLFESVNHFSQTADAIDHFLNNAFDFRAQAVDHYWNPTKLAEIRRYCAEFRPTGRDLERMARFWPESDTNGQVSATFTGIRSTLIPAFIAGIQQ
jgi:hypothetical protein